MQWVRNKYVGTPPSRRYGHTATAIGPHIIIFGGWDGGKPLNDVIVLRDRSVAERAKEEDQMKKLDHVCICILCNFNTQRKVTTK